MSFVFEEQTIESRAANHNSPYGAKRNIGEDFVIEKAASGIESSQLKTERVTIGCTCEALFCHEQ